MKTTFEWDSEKEQTNIQKHGVSFHEASTVLGDPLSWTFPDPDHSSDEDRFLTFGASSASRLLIVAHTDRGDRIRIISSRKMTRLERRFYEEKR